MDAVSSTFPRAPRSQPGYDVSQVERFLSEARRAYDEEGEAKTGIDAAAIRSTSFRMRRGGYSPLRVDEALERLEDAFAAREREREIEAMGEDAWIRRARERADEITARLSRPDGEKFRRVGRFSAGYDPDEVDRFLVRVQRYFRESRPMSVDEVRQVAFRTRRGGYSEAQVDLLLDAVIDVMLAVV
jgi:DivIVA domain-containing protein